jgi:hypothetical protein
MAGKRAHIAFSLISIETILGVHKKFVNVVSKRYRIGRDLIMV